MVMPGIHQLTNTLVMPYIYHAGETPRPSVYSTHQTEMTVLLAAESTLGHAEEAELHMPVSYLLQNVCSLVEGAFSRIVVISVKVLRGAL